MYLQELQRNWNTFGREDPLWAVASQPDKVDNGWDVQEFFETGTRYVARIVQWMETNGLPAGRGAALDFGCGVGRLTQPLCDHFKTCVGVDIAPSMIARAKEYNRFGARCVYRLNETDDLGLFPNGSFDMVHTAHVLQHIRPEVAIRYIAEFLRVLKPGGLAAFHCPSAPAVYAYPEEGVSCALSTGPGPLSMEHGTRLTVPVRVTNTGAHSIGMDKRTNAPVRLIHHWYNLDTDELAQNHGRMNLPGTVLGPGESLDMDYRAASPAAPGNYALALTALDYRGCSLAAPEEAQCSVAVLVLPATSGTQGAALAAQRPYSETHAIPVETVERVVASAGGRILHVESHQNLPGGQVSSLYYATR
ncbi:Methyltransferase type 11 [Pseudodesulfovibrio mercurii]|uniref:Methyltransferase type 11 n=1 Tax=Pseudodesulfovibrio mercurii TaxID=641491 RepID=F0JKK0_9BACT|nr:class I SAM-dependent methyltransferase [Pseudodesulfovibrio mercurii]EGB16449.1 Methyltransferase type 11 [Pseudodesulfovibrio mercurii]